jgi:hypothetical protein
MSPDETAAQADDQGQADAARGQVIDTPAKDVLSKVRETLDGLDSLSCDLHETIVFSGQRFYAVGRYIQASGNRMRLEFRIFPSRAVKSSDADSAGIDADPEATENLQSTGSLQQISDGSVLWSLWDNGGNKRLTRRNIREIMESVPETGSYKANQVLEDLGVGGMQSLLARVQMGMDFGKVREQTVGGTRFLVLTGRWSQKQRQEIFNINDPEAPLPDFIPDYIRIYIDAEANLPRRVQYLKSSPDPARKLVRPMITLDFRQLSLNEAIADEVFTFDADDEGLVEEDLTPEVIDNIKQLTQPASDAGAGAAAP